MPIFLNLCSKLLPVIFCNKKKPNWLYFLYDVALDLPKQLQFLVGKTICLENVYLEVVAQSSSMKKLFLKILQNLENTCAASLQLY